MQTHPKFTRAMLGYALWVAMEDALRNWLARRLIEIYGRDWDKQFPDGVLERLHAQYNEDIDPNSFSQTREILEYSHFPDIFEIVKFRKQANIILPGVNSDDLEWYGQKLYGLRNQIAHKPYSFNIRSLDDLLGCADWLISVLGSSAYQLKAVKEGVEATPDLFAQEIPEDFILSVKASTNYRITNNLPPMDYEYDGGFVGRRSERQDLKTKLLNKRIFPIITISGAGGVGKTALAHYLCEELLTQQSDAFEGVIWISAKKDRLTLTGIEEIKPTASTFGEVLDAMLSTFGYSEYLTKPTDSKATFVREMIVDSSKHGILLVIDNLETILHGNDELLEFLKEIPLPNKVLITSRIGLGEIEKRIPLKEMSLGDAIELFRRIAVEKSARKLAQLPNDIISSYVHRMSSYPLVIKWVIGQAALNKDFDRLVQTINSTESDISKFCFEYIFEEMLSTQAKKLLLCLASSDDDLTQAVLMHVVDLSIQEFEDVMMELELASLVIPDQSKDSEENTIVTRYGILPLTKAYLTSRGESRKEIREIKERLQGIQDLVQTSQQAQRLYELSLEYFGGVTEAELIASKSIAAAFTRNQAGDYLGALDALNRAAELAPNFPAIYRSRAVIESGNENFDEAIEMFEKAVKLKPNDPAAWFHWGNLEKDLANYDQARECYTKALELVDHKPTVLIAIGNLETRASNFTRAIEYFREAISLTSSDPSNINPRSLVIAYTSLAAAYSRWSEEHERNEELEQAIEKAQLGYDTMLNIVVYGYGDTKTLETETRCGLLLGKLYKRKKNYGEARQYLEEIIDTNVSPRGWSIKQRRYYVRACYHLILNLIEQGGDQLQQIQDIYSKGQKYISSDPDFINKYQDLKLLFEDQQRYEGKFIRVVEAKGYGFIECPEANKHNVFAHISQFVDEISDISIMRGVWVSFSLHRDNERISAKAIRVMHEQ